MFTNVNIIIVEFKIVNLLFSIITKQSTILSLLLILFMEYINQDNSPENISHLYQPHNIHRELETVKEELQYLSSSRFIFGNNSFLSKMFVTWVTPIAQLGYRRPLDFKDIPKLREDQRINDKLQRFEEIFKQQSKKSGSKPGRTLLKAILKYQWKQQCIFLLLTLLVLTCKITILLFNQQFIKYIETKRTAHDNVKYFVVYAFLLCIEMILTDGIFYFYNLRDRDLTYIISLMVYKKVLKYPLISSKQFQLAQIVNYSQFDADKFKWLHWEITIVIYSTLYTVICLGLVYYFVGLVSLVCVLLLIAVCYISFILFDVVEEVQGMFYKSKDCTIKVVQQILKSINFIKFNMLQKYFLHKVSEKRKQQLNALSLLCSLKTLINFIFGLVSPIMVVALFFLFLKFNNQHISTPLAFLILTIFNNIQVLAQDFPQWFSHLITTWVSAKRIENFLLASEINQTLSINYQCENQNKAIQIRNGNFFWQQINQQKKQGQSVEQNSYHRQEQYQRQEDGNSSKYCKNQHRVLRKIFHNLNIDFKLNEFTIIYGKVGSGKTSLFHSILNEMTCEQGSKSKVVIYGEISYSAQKPWLSEGTIKQNIVFFDVEDQNRLNQAIYYSNLQSDLRNFKDGINTQIGENGSNLSGGQRARISLARALYSNKNIYLFDDILSALDVHVSQFIVKNTLKSYLRDKTIVMSTNDMKILNQADVVYEIDDGDLRLMAQSEYKNKQYKFGGSSQLNPSIPMQNLLNRVSIQQEFKQVQMQDSNLILPENQQTGDIPLDMYKQFIDLNGNKIRLFAILLLFGCWSYLSYLGNVQIQDWCEDKNRSKVFLYLYLGLFFVSGLLLSLACILIQFCQIFKNETIHRNIMNSILHASVSQFFNRVPSGRILNRMTNDLVGFDLINFHQCKPLLISIYSIISCFIACIYVSKPIVLIPIFLLIFVLALYFNFFIKSQQQCLRLQKVSNSQIVSSITETINGIEVIRAFKRTSQILQKQISKVQVTRSIAITRCSLSHWLLIRDSFIVYISMLVLVFYCIFGEKSGAQLGIVLMYAINFNEQIGFIFPSILSFRERMIQFQRVVDLSKIQSEKGQGHAQQSSQKNKSKQEKKPYIIQFVNYSARYRKEAPLSLNNISLTIRAGTKLGIVGRTGAGKSSLFNSIFRLLQPAEGLLKINGKQIRQYDIEELRSQFTIIEQNPTIINGSLRENLDPNNCYGDSELKNALLSCKLNKFLQKANGLDQMISNKTMSIGQKQLISICRAILKKSKLVLMDEATASIDSQLSNTIEGIIYELFKQSTVLIIAHKLSTLQKSDEIIVLQDGMVVQYGERKDLLKTPQSMYHKMHVSNDTLYLI